MHKKAKLIAAISAAAVCVIVIAILLVSFFAPVSFDKWIYETVEGKQDFENHIFLDNADKMFQRFDLTNMCFRKTQGRLERDFVYNCTGSWSDTDKVTLDGNTLYAEADIRPEDGGTVKVTFKGTRRWYFDYDWEVEYNDELPDLNYDISSADDIPIIE